MKRVSMDDVVNALLYNFDPEDEYAEKPGKVDLDPDGRLTISYDGDFIIDDAGISGGETDNFVHIPRHLIPKLLESIIKLANEE